ncbi:MAG: hypothetical protein AB8B80_07115 [Marinicellaceae bacterium]
MRRSDRTENGWSTPVNVKLPSEGRVDWPSVSPNGEMLIFSWSAQRKELANLDINENFDLYTLDLTNTIAVPKPINTGDINRPRAGQVKTLRYVHNESLPSLTNNGSLYFMTERLDGIGERDIYKSQLQTDGTFTTAVPLAAPINSPERDDGVWVNAEESVMLLTYPNRGGQGGPDLFISFRSKEQWSQPLNIGAKINTQYAEFAGRLTPDNKSVLFTSDRPFDGQPQGLLQVWAAPIDLEDLKSQLPKL